MNTNKKLIYYVLVLSFSLLGANNVFAANSAQDFKYTGSGESVTITGYQGLDTDIVIPEEIEGKRVISIGSGAFSNKNLTSVVIPDGVTTIGESAFSRNNLTEISFPDSIQSIGDKAFSQNQLTSVDIPSGVTSIGNSIFRNNQLTSVSFPDGLKSIGYSSFEFNQIANLDLPNSLEYIGSYAFKGNIISNVTFPDGIKMIDYASFRDNQLTNVVIPESVTELGYGVFRKNQLTSAVILNSAIKLGVGVFEENQEIPEDLIIYGHNPSEAKSYAGDYNHTFKDLRELNGNFQSQDVQTTLNQGSLTIQTESAIDRLNIELDATSTLHFKNLGTVRYEVMDSRGVEDPYTVNMSISPFTKGSVSLNDFTFLFNSNQVIKSAEKKQLLKGNPTESVNLSDTINLEELRIENNQFIDLGEYEATLTLEVISTPEE